MSKVLHATYQDGNLVLDENSTLPWKAKNSP